MSLDSLAFDSGRKLNTSKFVYLRGIDLLSLCVPLLLIPPQMAYCWQLQSRVHRICLRSTGTLFSSSLFPEPLSLLTTPHYPSSAANQHLSNPLEYWLAHWRIRLRLCSCFNRNSLDLLSGWRNTLLQHATNLLASGGGCNCLDNDSMVR